MPEDSDKIIEDVVNYGFNSEDWGKYMYDGILFQVRTEENNSENYNDKSFPHYSMYVDVYKDNGDSREIVIDRVNVLGTEKIKLGEILSFVEAEGDNEFGDIKFEKNEELGCQKGELKILPELSTNDMKLREESKIIAKIKVKVIDGDVEETVNFNFDLGYIGDENFELICITDDDLSYKNKAVRNDD